MGSKEMSSVVKALKEFRTMTLGHPMMVHTNHKNKNLTHDTNECANARIMQWHLIIKEFMPSIKCTPVHTNVVADALSHMELSFMQHFECELKCLAEKEDVFEQQLFDNVLLHKFNVPVNFKKIHQV